MDRPAGSAKLLRVMNERALLALLLERGALTRGELRALTGLSKPTISDVLRRLTGGGLAIRCGQTSGGPGPNAEIYAPNPAAGYAVAIGVRETADTARAKLSAALCDLAGTVLRRSETTVHFGRDRDPVGSVIETVHELCGATGLDPDRVRQVTLGLPGSYDPAGRTIRHIDVPGWDRPGLADDLAAGLRAPVAVENDVNLATIAERRHGVAGEQPSFALMWFGEGLGLGIDLGGTLLRGARGGAGEIGYAPVAPATGLPGAQLQDVLGGPAVLELAAAYGLSGTDSAAQAVAGAVARCQAAGTPEADVRGAAVSEEAVARAAEERAGAARAAEERAAKARAAEAAVPQVAAAGPARFLDELAARIAFALAAVAAVLDPALIVLGGELAQAGGPVLAGRVAGALRAASPLEATVAVTGVTGDPVLLGALDSALRAVRETLIENLPNAAAAT